MNLRRALALPPFLTAFFVVFFVTLGVQAQAPVRTLDDFDQPFLFAYGTWDKKVGVADGVARLHGFSNQGGAGRDIRRLSLVR